MSDEQTTPMPDSEILAGLKREAICTVAPERMRLYGDAYVRIEQLNAERDAALAALESELAATKRECEGLREAARETPNRIRELSQFVDPKHHEKFHQLADVMETLMPEAARDATEGGA